MGRDRDQGEGQSLRLKKKFAEPTHYGLGKHGWVSCTFERDRDVPLKDALKWLDESFRAVAPKRVIDAMGR